MKRGEFNTSFVVISSIVFLFFIFLILDPPETTSNNLASAAIIDVFSFRSEETGVLSLTPLIIILVILLTLIGVFFLILKKIKHKKSPKVPDLHDHPKDIKSFTDEKKGEEPQNNELDELFEGGRTVAGSSLDQQGNLIPPTIATLKHFPNPHDIKDPHKVEPKEEPLEEKEPPVSPQKLEYLKHAITYLMEKKYPSREIIKILHSKGNNLNEITLAMEQINMDNIKIYIRHNIEIGFKQNNIKNILLDHGWDSSIIEEAFKQLGYK